jgi:hypothetical protein
VQHHHSRHHTRRHRAAPHLIGQVGERLVRETSVPLLGQQPVNGRRRQPRLAKRAPQSP